MGGFSLVILLGFLALSIATSLMVLWIAGLFITRSSKDRTTHPAIAETANTFLFHDGMLVDHDCTQTGFFSDVEDWPTLRDWLGDRFGDLPKSLKPGTRDTTTVFPAANEKDAAKLIVETLDETARISLIDPVAAQPADRHHAIRLQSALAENHSTLQDAPYAIWKTGPDGKVIWQNTACSRILGDQIEKILPLSKTPTEPGASNTSRVSVKQSNSSNLTWFDIQTTSTDTNDLHYATDITRAVQAEAAQREFVQTLTKTFANLTTGLAIFDRNKQLALFNPALVDLTALPAEFLSARPSLMSFFDDLRDRQVMPEPKNYAGWRAEVNEMIETASDGLYQETWSLPTGVTYRVTGRPHPDGAVAFLFEDISAEISLTRRFRAQNDLRQSVMDKLDHAVAVISSNNIVMFCNTTCTRLFGVDPDTSFAEMTVRDLFGVCSQKYPHPEFWKKAESQITCNTLLEPLQELIVASDGSRLHCRVIPVAGGSALLCRVPDIEFLTPKSKQLAS